MSVKPVPGCAICVTNYLSFLLFSEGHSDLFDNRHGEVFDFCRDPWYAFASAKMGVMNHTAMLFELKKKLDHTGRAQQEARILKLPDNIKEVINSFYRDGEGTGDWNVGKR